MPNSSGFGRRGGCGQNLECASVTGTQPVQLELVDDDDPRRKPVKIVAGARIVIGREASCDVFIDHPAISRQHAAIIGTARGATIEDLGSRHGTRVNSRELSPKQPVEVASGDIVQIGPRTLRLTAAAPAHARTLRADTISTQGLRNPSKVATTLELVNDSRPDLPPIVLAAGARLEIGRLPECDICVDDPAVSRHHARIDVSPSGVVIQDLGSRHGTRVNGQFVRPGRPIEISEGDVVQAGPRVLRFRAATSRVRTESHGEAPDAVRTIAVGRQGGAEQALRVLIDVVRGTSVDGNLETAGKSLLERLLSVTRLERALLVRFDENRADADIIAEAGERGRAISRTVLASAADPQKIAHLSQSTFSIQSAASIAGTGVREVICVRVVVEGDEQLYLYLDSASARAPVDASMAEFVGAAARLCGLMIESFARRRLEALRLDVERARLVQRRLLAEDDGEIGDFVWSLHSLPGTVLAGDFAGVALRPDGSVLSWVGDVAGKGAAAAMLMASAQSWMYASSTRLESPAETVRSLSAFLHSKSEPSEFATMFVSVLEPGGDVTICDAGHGIAYLVENGVATRIEADGGVPVGVDGASEYATSRIRLERGARIVVATDGVHEQRVESGEMFGLERMARTLGADGGTKDDVARLVGALRDFSGEPFDDDVTVLSIARK